MSTEKSPDWDRASPEEVRQELRRALVCEALLEQEARRLSECASVTEVLSARRESDEAKSRIKALELALDDCLEQGDCYCDEVVTCCWCRARTVLGGSHGR